MEKQSPKRFKNLTVYTYLQNVKHKELKFFINNITNYSE